ncbi:hypothetical protein D3C78_406440 [compost metagenome]
MHWRIHRQHQAAGVQGAGVLQQFVGFGITGEQALADAQQAFAQVGQLHRTLVAVEQQHPEALFELAHLVGHGRLGQKQLFCRPGEAAVHGHCVESPELSVGHRHVDSSNKLSLCVKYDKSILFISHHLFPY